ncbi:50S ribosomal protein L3 [Candidatus Gottesmanbacteria bacterium RIFCSPHIGHO2_02_FULL_39_11]|uniref:Large ribosomal subunit protein uL3 n=1 Tax=Candidatus Gottesmanbacteria bacterium RIFCSPHIGHO2_02_FULL_39_11 TaxID=1798382 RepID=A0A1F5ZWK8_9BACT|nr:MAG: 50S ribosomal protein L3 [Candidatus Gottesmanbacteria bacterium RIFCSPHIGHO2_02_FULL_39_11]
MIGGILATKIGQKQMFTPDGVRQVVTTLKAGPLYVVGVKTIQKDGYSAVQIGYGTRRPKTITQPVLGTLKKAGLGEKPTRFLREIRTDNKQQITDNEDEIKIGIEIKASDELKVGDAIIVSGTSKGKGFQGGVRRYGFKGGPRTHGQSDRERAPGSIGQTTTPGRVYKGKRMAGRMGQDTITIKNLKVISIDAEKQIMTITGVVPGGKNSLLIIRKMN